MKPQIEQNKKQTNKQPQKQVSFYPVLRARQNLTVSLILKSGLVPYILTQSQKHDGTLQYHSFSKTS